MKRTMLIRLSLIEIDAISSVYVFHIMSLSPRISICVKKPTSTD